MKKDGTDKRKNKLSKQEVAKIVKSTSRRHKLPPNKVEETRKVYKRNKKVDL